VKSLIETIKNIWVNDRRVMLWLLLLIFMGVALIVVTAVNLAPGVADGVIVRYSDNGGYAKGGWGYMLGFIAMGLVLGVGHALLAVRIYEKRGGSVAVMFIVTSIFLILLVLLMLLRLVGEG